jgi:adenosylmethionine-8-amino-7-oxononanoate aminotransferase
LVPPPIRPPGLGTLPPIKIKDKAAAPLAQGRQPHPPVASQMRTRGASDSVTASRLERLRSLGRTLRLSSLERVTEQHVEDLLKSMRKAGETAVLRASKCTQYSRAIRKLKKEISEKSYCFLLHLRDMGNIAVHSDAANFTPEEVNYLTRALAEALEEMIAKKLL